ncbi:MAG: tetratricopeptide repeat protein, partial [Minisyncoccia bacterium]
FTTYFNTYYNAELLLKKTEQEFEYYDENIRLEPRALAPDYEIVDIDNLSQDGVPYFMQEFVVSQAKLQPVKVKLDSVLIKGSKILARKSKSEYVEGTLYLMALAYFYKGEWLPSQVKCGELIDIYPDGEKSPDAHLLFAKSLLIQRKWDYGMKMLSRTVDIAWQLERYDILSQAFRLQADLSLYKGDKEGAMRPYLQAIAQTNDKGLQAKWQLET